MKDKELAIIIPAYKRDFLEETLESLSEQTDKRFRVYIGDDNSPFNLEEVVERFKGRIDYTYKKFKENLGGESLVAQWHRCIKLAEREKWIWLFSDDDIMEKNCVEAFYKELLANNKIKLFHFDVKIVDKDNKFLNKAQEFPEKLSPSEFIKGKISGNLSSFVVEYIFEKEFFWNNGGFVNFDLAWNSDDATWYQLSKGGGVHTIKCANVHWRSSGVNISRISKDSLIVQRKLNADIEFSDWLVTDIKSTSKLKSFVISLRLYLWYLIRLNSFKDVIGSDIMHHLENEFIKNKKLGLFKYFIKKYYHVYKVQRI
ncbi:glycosyltransferase family 2 protein [Labilibacter sediminis]|nr:glycosyltransferase family 2 protein [Labilibacter sediminis]